MSCVTCVAETDLPARMQIQRLLTAIVVYCSPYRKIEQAVMKTARLSAEFLPPRRLVSRPMVPTSLPMRFKRKYEHMDGMVDHTMQPERKLAYRPSHAVTESWVPEHMQMEPASMAPASMAPAPMVPGHMQMETAPMAPTSMAPAPMAPISMAPVPPRMCDSDIGLVRPPNMFKVSVDV